MTVITAIRQRLGVGGWLLAAGLVAGSVLVIVRTVDGVALRRVVVSVMDHPVALFVVVAVYGAAFVLRAVAWCRTLPGLSPDDAIAALHVSLGANHVLPFRLGEVLRITSVTRRAGIAPTAAVASTVALRAADVVAICMLALVLGPGLAWDVLGAWGPLLLALAMLAVVIAGRWSSRRARRHDDAHAMGRSHSCWCWRHGCSKRSSCTRWRSGPAHRSRPPTASSRAPSPRSCRRRPWSGGCTWCDAQ